MTHDAQNLPTDPAPPFEDFSHMEATDDDARDFEELAPYEDIPGAPEWFNKGRRIDWDERALVIRTLQAVRRQNALAQRQADAQQAHERYWRQEVEVRFNRVQAEQHLLHVRVDTLKESLEALRKRMSRSDQAVRLAPGVASTP